VERERNRIDRGRKRLKGKKKKKKKKVKRKKKKKKRQNREDREEQGSEKLCTHLIIISVCIRFV